MNRQDRIFVAGHRGLVGSALCRLLSARGFDRVIIRTRKELDLLDQAAVDEFFATERPDYVFMAAAKVGGILANDSHPADFLGENLKIQTNIIDSAFRHRSKKFCFLGSSCIYPKFAEQPIRETSLLTGPLEKTNEWYAIAKIAGIKMCQAYAKQHGFNAISIMPTNLYGPGDNFDLASSHVLPALIRKFHDAKAHGDPSVTVWGTGTPRREFLHVDDLANAMCHLMEHYDSPEIINVGVGKDISIAELATMVGKTVGYAGNIVFDTTKPDGTPRKLLDVSRLHALGWRASITLEDGIRSTYDWYVENCATAVDTHA
jgi:GDP-L-fucose synthase